jgi:uncharacterized sporulation protein YeaH/YhbH (DUF444 family)
MVDNDKHNAPTEETPRKSIVRVRQDSNLPPITNTHLLAARTVINPPGQPHKDRTGPDADRFKERNKPSKDKLPDIIKNNPILDDKGKVKVPIEGGKEPRWRPGRDGQGGGGGGGGKPGEDEADITYAELTYEEFLKLFFDGLELPFLLRKMIATTEVKTHKRRGITNQGPKSRLNKMESAKARLKRAIVMKNAHPEEFCPDFAGQCQAVFESYLFYAAMASDVDSLVESAPYEVLDEAQFLLKVANAGADHQVNEQEFRTAVLLAANLHCQKGDTGAKIPYTAHDVLKEHIEEYVKEELRQGTDIPGVDEVPFHKSDMKFGRIEEKMEPDSKAVAFLLMDRSGSMQDAIAIAKAFFLLNILFLRAKYKNVVIVMIAHDAHAERIMDERKFYQIEAGGGTVAIPAWKMTLEIAEAEFPSSGWNRYMFHATDGQLFDGEENIRNWWTKIVESPFNYCGYLEIMTSFSRGSGWDTGGEALLRLKPAIAAHVGMARVGSMQDLPRAFKEILDKDRVKS